MARKKSEALASSPGLSCSYCHHDNMTMRHIHWLKVFEKCSQETRQELYPHLMDQYPQNGAPWAISVVSWCHTMRALWGGTVDASGVPMPLWRAWIARKQAGTEKSDDLSTKFKESQPSRNLSTSQPGTEMMQEKIPF